MKDKIAELKKQCEELFNQYSTQRDEYMAEIYRLQGENRAYDKILPLLKKPEIKEKK
jgi:hypothetical protein